RRATLSRKQAGRESAAQARQHPAVRGGNGAHLRPRRQSRRDRASHRSRLPRSRHPRDRRLQRRRPRRAARPCRGRGVSDRPGGGARELPERGTEPLRDAVAARQAAKEIGYPVLLKPAGGGGGKGMRVVARDEGFDAAWRGATGEATAAFGQPALYLERQIVNARHVEMQILADGHGTVVWLGERDCSIQRRHQKLIEESPGPSVTEELRAKLGAAAVRIAKR